MTRDEAIKRLHKYAKYAYDIWNDGDADAEAFNMAIEALQQEPVKHGKWREDDKGYFYCDQCHKYPKNQVEKSDFCPNCGAKMDKE